MITFLKLGRKGNLGNQLFQIAAAAGIAKRNGHSFAFPKWAQSDFFEQPFPIVDPSLAFEKVHEPHFHFGDMEIKDGNYDLDGWFQSEQYFGKDVKKLLEFKPSFVEATRQKFKAALQNNPIVISVRRGDFVGHPHYFQLPILYYIKALYYHFPDWQQRNLILLSDDIDYCRYHFDFLPNVFFADNASAIEQLALSSLVKDFVISNSTFSWWCAWFGERPDSVIVRPEHNFSEAKRKEDDDKDFFPARWNIFTDHSKMDLGHITLRLLKANPFIEKYLAHHFIYKTGENAEIMLQNYIVPPLSIKIAADLAQENIRSTWLAKRNPVAISNWLDGELMQGQQDFGMFVTGKKLRLEQSDQVVFTCHGKNDNIASDDLKFHLQTGKLDIFAFSHFYSRHKKRGMFRLKGIIKKLIGYKKK